MATILRQIWAKLPISASFFFFITAILFIAAVALRIVVPILFSQLVTSAGNTQRMMELAALYAATFMIGRFFDEGQLASYLIFEQGFQKALSLTILRKYFALPFSVMGEKSTSETVIIVDRGLSGIRTLFYNSIFVIDPLSLEIFAFLVILNLKVNFVVGAILGAIISLFLIVTYLLSNTISRLQQSWFSAASNIYKILNETLRGYETIRSFEQVPWAEHRYSVATDGFIAQVLRSLRPGILLGAIQGLLLFALVFSINWTIIKQNARPDQLVATLVLANSFLVQMMAPLLQPSGSLRLALQGYSGAKQLLDLLRKPSINVKLSHTRDDAASGILVPPTIITINARDVLITTSDISIPAYQTTVITGPTGSGKFILARVIAGLIDSKSDIRSSIDISRIFRLPQEVDIFDMSIEDNVRLGLPLNGRL